MKKLNSFYTIFKDSNDWNEKSIVGFSSFVIMVLFAIADLVTGYFGKDLVINEYIYNSFLWIKRGRVNNLLLFFLFHLLIKVSLTASFNGYPVRVK